jgi:hypothetical protein
MKKLFLLLLFATGAAVTNAQHTAEYLNLKAQAETVENGWTLDRTILHETGEIATEPDEVVHIWSTHHGEAKDLKREITLEEFLELKIPVEAGNISTGTGASLGGINLYADIQNEILEAIQTADPTDFTAIVDKIMPSPFRLGHITTC